MKGIGLILLFVGVGLIAYAFNATEALNSAIAQVAASLPTNRTVWLLIGGSGAVVIGMTMIFRRPARSSSSGSN